MPRMEQVNALLQQKLAQLIAQEVPLPGGLITVTAVRCAPDLGNATVSISVLPEKYFGSVLRQLKKKTSIVTKQLQKKLKLRRIPRLQWKIDSTESEAAELEEVFQTLQ